MVVKREVPKGIRVIQVVDGVIGFPLLLYSSLWTLMVIFALDKSSTGAIGLFIILLSGPLMLMVAIGLIASLFNISKGNNWAKKLNLIVMNLTPLVYIFFMLTIFFLENWGYMIKYLFFFVPVFLIILIVDIIITYYLLFNKKAKQFFASNQ